MKKPDFVKWTAGSVGLIIGIAHIGVLGHLMKQTSLPSLPVPPVNDYSSYRITATRDGYTVEYRGNDPRVLENEDKVDRKSGFFGFGGKDQTRTRRQFTQDGAKNQYLPGDEEGKLTAQDIACIEAAGGGRSSGALAGASVAAAATPAISAIPYVGWLASGWAVMLGTDAGGSVGATVTKTLKGC